MTDRLALPLRYRKQLKALLDEHVPGVEVWAYGSRVNGESHEGSDLDLALRGPALEPLDGGFYDLLEAIEKSNIPILVQAHDWAMLPESFHREIERDYVVVQQGAEPKQAGEWRRVVLGDVIDLQLSSVDKKSKASEQAVQLCNYMDVYTNNFIYADMDFMTATATEREIARCSLAAGDVVITKDSEKHDDIGVPALVREDVPDLICGYHLAILRPRLSEIGGAYLFYALSTDEAQRQFHSYANGITRFGLRKADIGLVEIPLPPLPEQRAIGHVLGTLDDKIELNRRMNETLEAMARALFKSWFVDFEPVRAKMEGRWRRGESLPGLPAEHYDLFPDLLVDSELGEIPEGWGAGLVSQISKLIFNGGTPKRSEVAYWVRGAIPWLTSGEVRQSFVMNTQEFITQEGLTNSSAKIVPERSILVALYGATAGQICMNFRPLSTNQAISAIVPIEGSRYFCLVSLQSKIADLQNRAVGSAQQNISKREVESTNLLLPQVDLRSIYDAFVTPLFDRIFRNLDESSVLTAQRDALLPRLVSGEVRV